MRKLTMAERIERLSAYAGRVRGVERCVESARHAAGWRPDHPDVAYWVDQGECYAGLISAEEFAARHG